MSEATDAIPVPPAAVRPRASHGRVLEMLFGLRHYVLIPVLILAWEASVRLGWVNGNTVPAPSAIFRALVDMYEAGLLWQDVWASVSRVLVGFGLAAAAGISLGLAFGIWPRAAAYISPVVELLRPISVLAWIPLAILWFGLGDRSAWFIIFVGSFFPIFTNTYLGASSVATIHVRVAQSFGASRWLFVRKVLFPSSLPYIMTGLRLGIGLGWTCVIAAELIAATSGLGYMIQLARTMIETEKVMAGMVVIGLVGFAMNAAMMWLERRLLPWARAH